MATKTDNILSSIENHKLLPEGDVKQLCFDVKNILSYEPNILKLDSPMVCVGDIHGQFDDLLNIFQECGSIKKTKYLFLGDYVDRGPDGLETILYLFALKIKHPNEVYLLRGNHEMALVNRMYGFYDECVRKYGSPHVWNMICEVYSYLPICAILDEKIFCVHGGVSNRVKSIQDLRYIDRYDADIEESILGDILWSDPASENALEEKVNTRGAGVFFTKNSVEKFLDSCGLAMMIRAHQLFQEGFKKSFDDRVVTVFSAPNYCKRGNIGSVICFGKDGKMKMTLFKESKTYPKLSQKNS